MEETLLTTWDVKNLVNNGIHYLATGAKISSINSINIHHLHPTCLVFFEILLQHTQILVRLCCSSQALPSLKISGMVAVLEQVHAHVMCAAWEAFPQQWFRMRLDDLENHLI